MNRNQQILAAAVAAALILGFGGGFFAGRGGHHAPGNVAAEQTGFRWPFFGHPRAADARRATPPKPPGFAVWKTRIDTSGAQPLACVKLTRPLDRHIAGGVMAAPADQEASAEAQDQRRRHSGRQDLLVAVHGPCPPSDRDRRTPDRRWKLKRGGRSMPRPQGAGRSLNSIPYVPAKAGTQAFLSLHPNRHSVAEPSERKKPGSPLSRGRAEKI